MVLNQSETSLSKTLVRTQGWGVPVVRAVEVILYLFPPQPREGEETSSQTSAGVQGKQVVTRVIGLSNLLLVPLPASKLSETQLPTIRNMEKVSYGHQGL